MAFSWNFWCPYISQFTIYSISYKLNCIKLHDIFKDFTMILHTSAAFGIFVTCEWTQYIPTASYQHIQYRGCSLTEPSTDFPTQHQT